MAKKYKDDFDGVTLMRKSFPIKENAAALSKMETNKKLIKALSIKLFSRNKVLFGKVGLDEEDVESIFTCYSYILLNKFSKDEERILTNFLKQRGTKLVNRYKTLSDNIAETPQEEELDIETLAIASGDPEQLLIAQEEAGKFLMQVRSSLIDRSAGYVADFYSKNKKELKKVGVTLDTLDVTVDGVAFKYAEKKYQNSLPLDYQEFKRGLVSHMSKLLKKASDE